MRKLLLLALIFLNFSIIPSFADDQVADVTSVDTFADVLIDLPEDLPAGYHSAISEVTDPETNEISEEETLFCKDNKGEIHWDNICPDLDIVVDPATLEEIKDVADLPIYNPESEPEKTSQTQVAGFTALSVLSAGGAAAGAALGGGGASGGGSSGGGGSGGDGAPGKGGSGVKGRREDSGTGEMPGGVVGEIAEDPIHSAHAKATNQFNIDDLDTANLGIGDRSFTWRAPFTNALDSAIIMTSLRVSRFAPLFGKIFIDASYLRAIFGSLTFFTIPFGIFLGLQAVASSNNQPMPPTWQIFAAMALLSIFESVGGLVAATVFAIGIFATGNADSLSKVLTVLALSAIFVSPAMLAGSFRPFRRKLGDGETIWERGIDYLLAAVLTNWTFIGFINSLNVIAAKQLAITGHASKIGFVIGIGVILRMALEDFATYLYPVRTAKFAVVPPKPSKRQQYISNIIKAFIFGIVMESFIGFGAPLLIGTALFILT